MVCGYTSISPTRTTTAAYSPCLVLAHNLGLLCSGSNEAADQQLAVSTRDDKDHTGCTNLNRVYIISRELTPLVLVVVL